MESLFRWLAGVLAAILEKYADPQLQAKLDGLNAKVAAVEAREKEAQARQIESERAYAESEQRRRELDDRLAASQSMQAALNAELAESKKRQEAIIHEAQRLKDDVDRRSDDDAFGGGVPKSRLGAGATAGGDEAASES